MAKSIIRVYDGEACILCNGCADVCPVGCIEMVVLSERNSTAMTTADHPVIHEIAGIHDAPENVWMTMVGYEEDCILCRLCGTRCPVGAITFKNLKRAEMETAR